MVLIGIIGNFFLGAGVEVKDVFLQTWLVHLLILTYYARFMLMQGILELAHLRSTRKLIPFISLVKNKEGVYGYE